MNNSWDFHYEQVTFDVLIIFAKDWIHPFEQVTFENTHFHVPLNKTRLTVYIFSRTRTKLVFIVSKLFRPRLRPEIARATPEKFNIPHHVVNLSFVFTVNKPSCPYRPHPPESNKSDDESKNSVDPLLVFCLWIVTTCFLLVQMHLVPLPHHHHQLFNNTHWQHLATGFWMISLFSFNSQKNSHWAVPPEWIRFHPYLISSLLYDYDSCSITPKSFPCKLNLNGHCLVIHFWSIYDSHASCATLLASNVQRFVTWSVGPQPGGRIPKGSASVSTCGNLSGGNKSYKLWLSLISVIMFHRSSLNAPDTGLVKAKHTTCGAVKAFDFTFWYLCGTVPSFKFSTHAKYPTSHSDGTVKIMILWALYEM